MAGWEGPDRTDSKLFAVWCHVLTPRFHVARVLIGDGHDPDRCWTGWAVLTERGAPMGDATKKKSLQAAAPTGKGHVFKQPRYEVRPQPLPLIDQEKRHLLYLNRHHASIVMTSVVSRIDRMESVFHGPGGYHIRVHQGPAFGDRGRAISRRPARDRKSTL